jgi:DNA primase
LKETKYNVLSILEYLDYLPDERANFDTEIKIICPYHEENVPSCSISITNGLYHCFGCGKNGSIIDLISKIKNVNSLKAIQIAAKVTQEVGVSEYFKGSIEQVDKSKMQDRARAFYDGLSIPSWDYIKNHYLFERGLNRFTLKHFKVKINHSSLYPIIIPIFEQHVFKGYVLRREDKGEPKYLYSRGFSKINTLAGNIIYN